LGGIVKNEQEIERLEAEVIAAAKEMATALRKATEYELRIAEELEAIAAGSSAIQVVAEIAMVFSGFGGFGIREAASAAGKRYHQAIEKLREARQ
jgi:hypothetical protein